MRVIINADDFGYSHQMNVAIENAIKAGSITSSTIIANAPVFDEAISMASKYDNISFGVHLNIIEFRPLTNISVFDKYGLLDSTGQFVMGAIFRIKKFSNELKSVIKEEWVAQIEKVRSTGIVISHIDSHQHTHAIPALQDILVEVLSICDIKKCRTQGYASLCTMMRTRNNDTIHYPNSGRKVQNKKSFIYRLYNHLILLPIRHDRWVRNMKKVASIPDSLLSYYFIMQDIKAQAKLLANKTIELECHPGLAPNQKETDLLMNKVLQIAIPNIKLINYKEL